MKKYHSLEEMTNKYVGKRGSAERESFEADVEAVLIGAAIKDARKAQNLTQKELGIRVGVQTAQISRIESGRNLTISTIVRVLKGLGLTADFSIDGMTSITLGAS